MSKRGKINTMIVAALLVGGTLMVVLRDWNAELTRLAAGFQSRWGVAASFGGPARLTLLPPAIVVEDVALSRDDETLARASRLSVRVSPWSLLGGPPQVTGLVLSHARLGNWNLDSLELRLASDHVDGFSKWNGHAVTFSANVDRTRGDTMTARLSVPSLSAALRFDGALETGPALTGRAVLNVGNLGGLFPALGLPAGQTLKAEADLDMGDGQLSLVNLSAEALGSKAGGSLVALAGSPALVEADLEIDRLDLDAWRPHKDSVLPALLPKVVSPPAESKPPEPTASTASPAPGLPDLPDGILGNVRLNVGTLSWRGQDVRGLEVRAGLDQGNLVIRHATAGFGDRLRVDVDGVASGQAFNGRLRLNGPGLSGRTDLRAGAQGIELANLIVKRDNLVVRGDASGQWGEDMAVRWQGAVGQWADTRLTARLRPAGSRLDLPELDMAVGALALRGRGSVDWAAAKPRIEAQLRGDDIDLATLPTSPLPVHAAPQPKLGGKAARRPAAETTAAKPAAPRKGGSPFSAAPLDWSALTMVDGTFDFAAHSLTGGFGRIDQPSLKLVLADGTATLENLQGRILDGTLAAKGKASAAPLPSFQMEAEIKGADLARLRPTLAGLGLNSGRADLTLRLKAQGKSSLDMAASAVGNGQLEVRSGTIDGLDLAAINGQLGRIQNFGNVLALAQTGLKGGQTRFGSLTGSVAIADGSVRSPDLKLKAEGGSAAADLSVALRPWTTDTTLSLALEALPATPLVLRLSGSVDNPRTNIDANALQKALVQSGLGRALGGGDNGGDGEAKGGRKMLQNLFKAFGG